MNKTNSSETKSNDKIVNYYFGSYDGKIYSVPVDISPKSKRVLSKFAFKVSDNSVFFPIIVSFLIIECKGFKVFSD